ncbi:MAG: hypothetical protein JW834_03165 [Candidatus Diapherotrites archaeon]|nr:hypothetical protein [Candidatus Diapherotrites archaeon]
MRPRGWTVKLPKGIKPATGPFEAGAPVLTLDLLRGGFRQEKHSLPSVHDVMNKVAGIDLEPQFTRARGLSGLAKRARFYEANKWEPKRDVGLRQRIREAVERGGEGFPPETPLDEAKKESFRHALKQALEGKKSMVGLEEELRALGVRNEERNQWVREFKRRLAMGEDVFK